MSSTAGIQSLFAALANDGSETAKDPATFDLAFASGVSLPSHWDSFSLHQQGIQLVPGAGYIASGSADRGYFYVSDKNRNIVRAITLPYVQTKVVPQAEFDQYDHIGGFQIADFVLAAGAEWTGSKGNGTSVVELLNVGDLLGTGSSPTPMRVIERPTEGTAGATGICAVSDGWVVVVGNYGSTKLDFYKFQPPSTGSPFVPTPAALTQAAQRYLGAWHSYTAFQSGSVDSTWPSGDSAYQNINLFSDTSGLWMIAMGNDGSFTTPDEDWADLYQVTLGHPIGLKKIAKMHFKCTGGGQGPRFMYGSGVWHDVKNQKLAMVAVSKHQDDKPVINQFPQSVPYAGQ